MKTDKVIPRLPSGFLELLPKDQIIFNWMLSKVKSVYERFGYLPIETPAVELKEVLLAKGGGEIQQQVFGLSRKTGETDMCLHFDLTVPLARYVVEHMQDITFPFRRHQIQKVWRGERAQRGRYREFYQCDIDVIGTTNPLTDAEIPSVIYSLFKEMGLPKFTIGMNNRKLLYGLLQFTLEDEQIEPALIVLDKLQKNGVKNTVTELIALGVARVDAEELVATASFRGSYEDLLDFHPELFDLPGDLIATGLEELKTVYYGVLSFGVPSEYINIDLGIIRGLAYYTGTVYETLLDDFSEVGSICSGGRYDDLCKYYTDRNLPGVGISIGLSRLFAQLKDAGLLPKVPTFVSAVLLVSLDESSRNSCMEIASKFRAAGINCEVYLENAKVRKQLKYADDLGIPFVVLVGETELSNGQIILKKMNGQLGDDQLTLSIEKAIGIIKHDTAE